MASNTEILLFCKMVSRGDPSRAWWWQLAYEVDFFIFWLLAILPEKLRRQS